jgi:hypothetical protein
MNETALPSEGYGLASILAGHAHAVPPDVEAEVETFRENYVKLSDDALDKVNGILRRVILDDREAMAKQTERWRREAAEEFTEARARERMDESDSRYDERVSLSEVWDADPIKPTVCSMTDGQCLFYEGERNVIYGPSEAGKTWLAIHAAIQEVKTGRPVFYIDYENGRHGFKDRVKAYGVTREEAEKLVWYFEADGGTPPSPEKVKALVGPFREQGGRLVVVDTTTPGMRSLGLNPLGEVDVETFYVLAGDPWAKAGCCWLTVDHTPGADANKHYGNQQKKAGVTGMSVNVVENVKFNRRMAGYSDVFIAKDRHGGGPEAANDQRQVARLHVRPGVTLGADVGVLELEPVDGPTLASEKAAEKAVEDMEKRRREEDFEKRVKAWVRKYDDGDGLPKTWITKGDGKPIEETRVPRIENRGLPNDTVMWALVAGWLSDASHPLDLNDKKRIVLDPDEAVAAETLETV